MPRRGRGRSQELRRREPQREPRRRILIVCAGKATEGGYFKALWSEFRNRLVDIEIDNRGAVPKTVVERAAAKKKEADREARRRRDDFLRYDEVWCVFDVDDHPNLPDARQQAQANGIELAISNPCFELWPLLHFQDHTREENRKRVQSQLKKYVPGYHKALPFDQLRAGYGVAVKRAQELDRRCEADGQLGRNPSTGVYRLTERIREGGKEEQMRKLLQESEP